MVAGSDPERLIAAQRPGWALTGPFYTDPALFERELERLFFRRWLYTGHESRIPEPGDYFTYQVGQEPLLLIRGDDGQVRALFNVCRHKGSRLCLEPRGTARKLVCPYHQWVYERDGSLLHARHMPEAFARGEFGLNAARVRIYEGLIFVCLAAEPPPLPEPPRDWIAPYDLARAKEAHLASYDVRANWKIVVENFLECYHCAGVHPEYTRVMAGAGSSYLSSEEMAAQSGRSAAEWSAVSRQLGLAPDRPALPFRRGACTQSMDGRPVALLMGTHADYDGTMMGLWFGWTLEMEANPDHVCTFRFTPLEVERTDVQVGWLVRGDAVEGQDYQRERLIEFWRITGEQDWRICEVVQSGVRSRHYAPGPLSPGERYAAAFLRDYLEQLAEG